ncbi:ASST-domain-containing protein [Podospora aff. communis PSN243]|uniref:ASST-domain-containing protein n=1 Tax=Podospora aff. communis PSN243 TaxID=3040156 RepID=A0AAV9G6M3_9PEZI|nr:ASST-domain-containing protein [Podospora aff. communis PSN243]
MAKIGRIITVVAILSVLPAQVLADWQYRSRPDLSPPRLNITIPATEEVAPGYIFVAPYPAFDGRRSGPEQPAAYIFRNNGDLVWSSLGYFGGWIANFQAVRYQGRPVLQAFHGSLDPFHGRGYGTAVLLDQSYRQIVTMQSLHKLMSIHEFRIVNEKTALVVVYQPVPFDLRPYGGDESQQWIIDCIWQELNIETGELLFEGHSLNFADPSESALPLPTDAKHPGTTSAEAWDYFHINSVDKDDQGNYLISSRHTSTVYKLSGINGSVIWRLGGPKSTFPLSHDLAFAYQHDARFLSRSSGGTVETISLLDNAALKDGTEFRPSSSARIFELNHASKTATELQRFSAPNGLSARSQGNAQPLPNQNVFVNWGQAGAITEFHSGDGKPIFHAYLDSGLLGPGVESYRGFRYEWDGQPREAPAVVALRAGGEISVYVSWNGDTRTAIWEFYAATEILGDTVLERAKELKLGVFERVSFETKFGFPTSKIRDLGEKVKIFAVALNREGQTVGRSSGVGVRDEIRPAGRRPEESEHRDL